MGMILYGFVSDRYMKYKRATEGRTKPEHRLLLMVLGSIALPVGLLIYGWSAARHVYWIVPIIGTGVVGFSMLLTILPTENYLIDIYEVHGASAVAAGVIMRALFGAMLPLTGPPMYSALGLGWGNSVLAFVTLVFVPILFLLMRYGERIRLN
jgi:MFS family permease